MSGTTILSLEVYDTSVQLVNVAAFDSWGVSCVHPTGANPPKYRRPAVLCKSTTAALIRPLELQDPNYRWARAACRCSRRSITYF
ncbi:hypothetical protein PsYK624_103730 [Phanerochaete sordida]|uniref:Uncharacterized protein n=1 Tax=Phanerochaete sordida TaxID=48140 RepID=A0A9P3GFZ1_9APHY|nr:hypothetical protein PsYK624_103730 [Phanerochaete sordida]